MIKFRPFTSYTPLNLEIAEHPRGSKTARPVLASLSGVMEGRGGGGGGGHDNALYPLYGGGSGGSGSLSHSLTARQTSPQADSYRSGVGGWEAYNLADKTGVSAWVSGVDEGGREGGREGEREGASGEGHPFPEIGARISLMSPSARSSSPKSSRTMAARGNRLAPLPLCRPPVLGGGAGAAGWVEEKTFGAAMANARKLYAREKQR